MRQTTGTLLVIGLLAAAGAWAQDASAPEPPPRYTVEMIIFTYAQDVATAGEIFLPDDPEPDESLSEDDDDSAQPAEPPVDVAFVRLARDKLTMNDVLGQLRRLDIYQPVMHFGWTQSVHPQAVTRPMRLASVAPPSAGLDGTLQLYLSRFLHLVVDIEMTADAADSFADPRPVRYRISEDRIFRSGELRYFDHPKFGVLARVTRADEKLAAGQTELLGYPAE